MEIRRGFGSDNHSGAHPRAMEALASCNAGHTPAYGDDPWTGRAKEAIAALFGGDAEVFLTLTGTGANVISLGVLCRNWEAVICPETAHINIDECGAPEKVAGVKLVPVATPDGKLTPELVSPHLTGFGFEHHAQPRAISISQATEYGTIYSPEEVRALADLAHEHDMILHMDGARLANAAAALDVPVRAFTVDAGLDVLSFGGTKNGMVFGEAVVFFGDTPSYAAPYVRKQSTQLASKMRYIGAQFEAMLADDLWLELAKHANSMAARLAEKVSAIPGVSITQVSQANEVFARLPHDVIERMQEEFTFYTWDEAADEVRWVCSWDTTPADVDALVARLAELAG